MSSDLNNALKLVAEGFRVFPLEPNSKVPMRGTSWLKLATTDPAKVERLWRDPVMGWEADWGVGIATGQGLMVFDADPKNGGMESLQRLEFIQGDLPASFRVRTPSGGIHIYLRTETPVANSAGKIAPGVDIRGEGGYVVGPGTMIDGKQYEVIQ